jgi:hypothetical protein
VKPPYTNFKKNVSIFLENFQHAIIHSTLPLPHPSTIGQSLLLRCSYATLTLIQPFLAPNLTDSIYHHPMIQIDLVIEALQKGAAKYDPVSKLKYKRLDDRTSESTANTSKTDHVKDNNANVTTNANQDKNPATITTSNDHNPRRQNDQQKQRAKFTNFPPRNNQNNFQAGRNFHNKSTNAIHHMDDVEPAYTDQTPMEFNTNKVNSTIINALCCDAQGANTHLDKTAIHPNNTTLDEALAIIEKTCNDTYLHGNISHSCTFTAFITDTP